MGLIWSMMPSEHKTARYQPPRNFGPQTVEFRLMRGTRNWRPRACSRYRSPRASSESPCTMAHFAARCFYRREKTGIPQSWCWGDRGAACRRAALRGWPHVDSPHSRWPISATTICRKRSPGSRSNNSRSGVELDGAPSRNPERPPRSDGSLTRRRARAGTGIHVSDRQSRGSLFSLQRTKSSLLRVHSGTLCVDLERRRARVPSRTINAQSGSGDAGGDRG